GVADEAVDLYRDPNATFIDGDYHYSANQALLRPVLNATAFQPYRLEWLRRSSEVVLAGDGTQRVGVPPANAAYHRAAERFTAIGIGSGHVNASTLNPAFTNNDDPIVGSNTPNIEVEGDASTNNLVRWRQGNNSAANMVYADGHVETTPIGELLLRNFRNDP
ncbi:MAG: hypothetical protein AAFX76_10440, partial [Planctomycetota bacterium]